MSRTPVKSDFWSQRKAGVQAEAVAAQDRAREQEHALEMERIEEQSDSEILDSLGLPSPESLKAGDDFTGFMAKTVPERLRRRALRQLWGSNPVLANVDGLVDYGEDFTDASMVIENMQTAYQVGKGMLKHVEEMARQSEAAQELEDEDAEQIEELDHIRPPESLEEHSEGDEVASYEFVTPLEEVPNETIPRRRMRFTQVAQSQDVPPQIEDMEGA